MPLDDMLVVSQMLSGMLLTISQVPQQSEVDEQGFRILIISSSIR